MLKVKISPSYKMNEISECTAFDITLKSKKRVERGELLVDGDKKCVSINLGRELTNEKRNSERLAILIELFYFFSCRSKQYVGKGIEEYKFVDQWLQTEDQDCGSIISELMNYELDSFDSIMKKEKILYYIKDSSTKVFQNATSKTDIDLGPILGFSSKDIDIYKKILLKYLKCNQIRGRLIDISYEYNIGIYKTVYYQTFSVLYAYAFRVEDQ